MSTKYQIPGSSGPRQVVLLAVAAMVLILGSILLLALTVEQLKAASWRTGRDEVQIVRVSSVLPIIQTQPIAR